MILSMRSSGRSLCSVTPLEWIRLMNHVQNKSFLNSVVQSSIFILLNYLTNSDFQAWWSLVLVTSSWNQVIRFDTSLRHSQDIAKQRTKCVRITVALLSSYEQSPTLFSNLITNTEQYSNHPFLISDLIKRVITVEFLLSGCRRLFLR